MTRWNTFPGKKKESKYHAHKVMVNGQAFDSLKEMRRYNELRLMEKAGIIKDLERQKKYLIIPECREPGSAGPRGGIKTGRVIERAAYYIADFVYRELDPETREWNEIVEDVKGLRTDTYILKRKLMLYMHGIRIRET